MSGSPAAVLARCKVTYQEYRIWRAGDGLCWAAPRDASAPPITRPSPEALAAALFQARLGRPVAYAD